MPRLLLLAPVALLLGCGYALVGKASNIPETVEAIYVAPFENRTQRSEVEQILTRAIAEELVTRRRFDLVDSGADADAILSGTVVQFNVSPLTLDPQGRATEYQIAIGAAVAFKEVGENGRVLWENDRYVYKESYPVETSQADYFDRENLAIEEVAGKFARNMIVDLLEGF